MTIEKKKKMYQTQAYCRLCQQCRDTSVVYPAPKQSVISNPEC